MVELDQKKPVDFLRNMPYNISCRCGRYERNTKPQRQDNKTDIGVWLSLARAPGLGPGGRRFESCHPDAVRV